MVTVLHSRLKANGFQIKLEGDRHNYQAEDLEEVGLALEHYFRGPSFDRARHANTGDDKCPLCRNIAKQKH